MPDQLIRCGHDDDYWGRKSYEGLLIKQGHCHLSHSASDGPEPGTCRTLVLRYLLLTVQNLHRGSNTESATTVAQHEQRRGTFMRATREAGSRTACRRCAPACRRGRWPAAARIRRVAGPTLRVGAGTGCECKLERQDGWQLRCNCWQMTGNRAAGRAASGSLQGVATLLSDAHAGECHVLHGKSLGCVYSAMWHGWQSDQGWAHLRCRLYGSRMTQAAA